MADLSGHRCPYLGLPDDPYTWYAFPAAANRCHRTAKPLPIPIDHQLVRCLGSEYGDCPVFKLEADRKGSLSTDKAIRLLAKRRRRAPGTTWLVVGLIIVVIVAAGYALSVFLPLPLKPLTSLAPQTRTPTATPTASVTPNSPPPPTYTSTPSATATPSPSFTPLPLEVTVAFDSNLRDQPIMGSSIITRLLSGTKVVVLGRDRSLKWVLVQIVDTRRGWLALTQIREIIDMSSIPFVTVTLTQALTKQP